MEKLRRIKKQKKLTGLCAGLARALGVDVSYVRFAWLAVALVPPFNHLLAVAAYALLAWIVPVADKEFLGEPDEGKFAWLTKRKAS
ncbi:MAG: PspC domain-containing protein [Peptococcaceae bacterium]|nr:PspC domain-containing protein [Peptococcaceae bacterium]